MSAAIDIRDLSVGWMTPDGLKMAVHDFNLTLKPGEIVGLVGESGSGKSTAMLAAIRALPAPGVITGGSVRFQDDDVMEMGEAALRTMRWGGISMVPQSALSALNPVLTIGAQFEDTLRAHGQTEGITERAVELMRLVELDPIHLRSYPHQLSGGMRQRVALALALALDPSVVIMDEPTTALDVVVEQQIIERILVLRAQRRFGMIFITHDLSLLMEFADRIAVLYQGKLVEVADTDTIRAGGQHPYTQKLIRSIPKLHGELPEAPPREEPQPLLKVEGLGVTFPTPAGPRQVVKDLSMALDAGECVALVGESGSGKSTIAKLITGLVRPSSGVVKLGGQPLASVPGWRQRIQMIFQDPFGSLNPAHTVRHHILRPLKLHRPDVTDVDAEIGRLLTASGLSPEFAARRPFQLSGGQRQRVAIARALAPRPDVILADEPTSMLDVSIRMDILRLLQSLVQEQGVAMLFITHDLAAARFLADRIFVLNGGQVMESGPSEELINNPQHPYTQQLLDAARRG